MGEARAQALVPVKDLGLAKSRLAAILTAEERRALSGAMLKDVVTALLASPGVGDVTLVSDDPVVETLARDCGVDLLGEHLLEASGLNPVITAAVAHMRSLGKSRIVVLHSDLPYLHADDIAGALDLLERSGGLVIGPDRVRSGTNLLAFESDCAPRFGFGSQSYAHHQNWARTSGVIASSFERRGVAMDIDTPADVAGLLDHAACRPGPNTETVVRSWPKDRIIQMLRRPSVDSGLWGGSAARSTGGGVSAGCDPDLTEMPAGQGRYPER